jgi:DNA repair exonuclease SbcCD ATPase subunit
MIREQQNFKADLSGSDRQVSERHCQKQEERRVFRPLAESRITSHGELEASDNECPRIDGRDKLCALLLRAVEHVKSDRLASAYECTKLAVSTLEEQIKATALPKVPLSMWKDSLGGY